VSDHLAAARQEAVRLQHDYLGSEHLLLALIASGDPALGTILGSFSVTPEALRERVEKRSPQGKGAPENPEEISLRSGARRALDQARALAQGGEPSGQQLLGALLQDGRGVVASSLADLGIPVAKVREALGIARPERPEKAERVERTEAKAERAEKPEREPRPEKAERAPKSPREPRPPRAERAEAKAEARAESRAERGEGRRDRREGEGRGAPPPRPRMAPVHDPFLTWRKLPLLAIPASLYFAYPVFGGGPFPHWLVFATACLAVLPLAGYMGEATEHLSARTGPTLGGFLNATFGNAAELIIAIAALRAGQVELVKASITGSILGNLLLIMGLSLLAGGIHRPIVRFSRTAVGISAGMLAIAVTGLVFPAVFHALHPAAGIQRELYLSEAVAIVLAITYGLSLLFSLKTHSRVFGGEPHPTEHAMWGVGKAVLVLGLATVGVAIESEILVHAVEPLTAGTGISKVFLGLIVIPIIGNAAEHATAVVVARKGKLDLALQIALGSSTQVALLVAPILVFVGAAFGVDGMNLVFSPLEVAAVGLSTVLAAIVTLDGESHWFEGVQLLALYAMVAIAVFFI
jgi:Ca2+:H+ antiporter